MLFIKQYRKHLILLALLVILFAGNIVPTIPPAKALTKIKVAYMPQFFMQEASLYTAKLKGFFEQEGLDVELVKFASGPLIVAAMQAGEIQIGELGWGAASQFTAKGVVKMIVADGINTHGDVILAYPGSGINKISDLKNKTVIVSKGTSGELILLVALSTVGLTLKDVKEIDIPNPADAVPAFINHQADAFATWFPSDQAVKDRLPGVVVVADNSNFLPEWGFINGYFVLPSYFEKNKDVIAAFIRAYAKAHDYFVTHVDEIAELATQFNGLNKTRNLQNTEKYLMLKFSDMIPLYKNGTVTKWYRKLVSAWVALGKLPPGLDPEPMVDLSFALEVLAPKTTTTMTTPTQTTTFVTTTTTTFVTTSVATTTVIATPTSTVTPPPSQDYTLIYVGVIVLAIVIIGVLYMARRKR